MDREPVFTPIDLQTLKRGQIGYYDFLPPLYVSFHEDDKTFSLMWTEYNDSFKIFYNAYLHTF